MSWGPLAYKCNIALCPQSFLKEKEKLENDAFIADHLFFSAYPPSNLVLKK